MKRRVLIGGAAAALAAIAATGAGLYRFTDLFVKHYPPTPYDDVLARLVDRGAAARLGAAVKGGGDAPALAARLRARLGGGDLGTAAEADVAAGRMTEVEGWLLPESIMLAAALAARV